MIYSINIACIYIYIYTSLHIYLYIPNKQATARKNSLRRQEEEISNTTFARSEATQTQLSLRYRSGSVPNKNLAVPRRRGSVRQACDRIHVAARLISTSIIGHIQIQHPHPKNIRRILKHHPLAR